MEQIKKIKYQITLNYIEAKTIKYTLEKEKTERQQQNKETKNETLKEINDGIIEVIDKIINYFN